MRLLSRLLSSLGLLALVAGAVLYVQTGGDGTTVLRWDLLTGAIVAAAACFVLAWRVGPRP
jgi:hypothetical protein